MEFNHPRHGDPCSATRLFHPINCGKSLLPATQSRCCVSAREMPGAINWWEMLGSNQPCPEAADLQSAGRPLDHISQIWRKGMDLNHQSPVLRTGALILLPFQETNNSMFIMFSQQLNPWRRTEASNLSPCGDYTFPRYLGSQPQRSPEYGGG
jgi:hypothetical protein